jgi:hypothetical protein
MTAHESAPTGATRAHRRVARPTTVRPPVRRMRSAVRARETCPLPGVVIAKRQARRLAGFTTARAHRRMASLTPAAAACNHLQRSNHLAR